MKTIPIDQICVEISPFVRAGVSDETVNDYAEIYRAGKPLPEPVVFIDDDGGILLADGRHRLSAALAAGFTEIRCEVMRGGYDDALRYACASNVEHGLRRTNADKRVCVAAALKQWPKQSDRQLGELCMVCDKTVASVREELGCGNPHQKVKSVGTKPERKETKAMARRLPDADVEYKIPAPAPVEIAVVTSPRAFSVPPIVAQRIDEIVREACRLGYSDPKFRHMVDGLLKLQRMVQAELPGMETQIAQPNKAHGTFDEVRAYITSDDIGLPESDAVYIFNKWDGSGWQNGRQKIRDWKATVRSWKAAGYFPSQKVQRNGSPDKPKHWAAKELDRDLETLRREK